MRLFKKHKAKDKLSLNVGIKECSTCDMNLRCEECVYQKENENIKLEIERLEKKEIEIDDFCRRLCRMRMLNGDAIASYEDLQNYIQEAKSEAIKEFTERLKNKIKTECNPYGKPTFDYDTSLAIMRYIDNLVKRNGR